jgi:hypothetical protein
MRALLAIVIPLALPTALYLIYAKLARRRAGAAGAAALPTVMPWSWLLFAGALLALTTFLVLYLFDDGSRGRYHPAVIIDGEIKPGYVEDEGSD